MKAAFGYRRLAIGLGALVAVVIAIIAVIPWLIPAERVKNAVLAEFRAATGLEPILRGDVRVSVFPSGLVSFTDVAFGDADRPALKAERLDAHLRLPSLLIGRIEVAAVWLIKPRITFAWGSDGLSDWQGLRDKLTRALTPTSGAAEPKMSFSEVRIADGVIEISDPARSLYETLTEVDLSLAWPAISKSFGLTGRLIWRDEPVNISLTISDVLAAMQGERSGIKARIAAAPMKAAFDGSFSALRNMRAEGMISADALSFRRAARWVFRRELPTGGFGPFALKAQAHLAGDTLSLSTVNLELDGNVAEGGLSLVAGAQPLLKGTIAANHLMLTPYFEAFHGGRGAEREWSRTPMSLEGLQDIDLDFRLSAAQITAGSAKIGRTGIGANLRHGKMTITIGESQAFDGILKGSITLAHSVSGADLKTQLVFSDVNLERCFGELFGNRKLEGKGNFATNLEARGNSSLALAHSLTGNASLIARDGALAGLNVEQLLKRLERRPLSGGGDFKSGRTTFERLTIALKVNQGEAQVSDVRLDGSVVRIALSGSASIPERDLDLKGTASLLRSAAIDSETAFELPFVVQGPWNDPIMLPDPQILIRRSGAAAPLLDAVKDQKTRDAVRSAIDQLTRSRVPAPAAGQPAQ